MSELASATVFPSIGRVTDGYILLTDATGYVVGGHLSTDEHPHGGYKIVGTSVIDPADIAWPDGERWAHLTETQALTETREEGA